MRIAVIEDEQKERLLLVDYLRRYEEENQCKFSLRLFADGDEITRNYKAEYDLILMDIEMAFQDGMSAAKEIREMDEEVIILFVTNARQYVMKGYEVGALDYLLKPVTYFALANCLDRARKKMDKKKTAYIKLNTKGGFQKVEVSHIRFLETENREMVFHTLEGEFRTRDTIRAVEEMLNDPSFFRCNKGVLVNLAYIDGMEGGDIRMGKDIIQVSRAKKKELLEAMNKYLSEMS